MLTNLQRRRPRLASEIALVLTLALGIAGLTVTEALVVQSRPDRAVVGEGEIVWIVAEHREHGYRLSPAGSAVERWKTELSAANAVAGFETRSVILRQGRSTETLGALFVGPDFFELVAIGPASGRVFDPEEYAASTPVCLISPRLARRFPDGGAIGEVLYLDREPFTVVGVLPPGFEIPLAPTSQVDVVRPFPPENAERPQALVRLRTDRTIEALQAELDAQGSGSVAGADSDDEFFDVAMPAAELQDSRRAQLIQFILLATFVLTLVTVSNLVNLLAIRSDGLREGTAVRWALGADRATLARWRLQRMIALGAVATLLAFLLAAAGLRLFETRLPPDLAFLAGGRLDPWTLVFLALVALGLATAFEIVPLRRLSAPKLRRDLTSDPRFGQRPGLRKTVGQLQVVVMVALTVVLLVGTFLSLASLASLERVDTGFDLDGLQVVDLRLPELGYETPEQRLGLLERFQEELSRIPEIADLATLSGSPVAPGIYVGRLTSDTTTLTGAGFSFVGADFFATTGLGLIAGREFTPREVAEDRPVVVLSESLSRELVGDPVDRIVSREILFDGQPRRVVGVASDVQLPAYDRPYGTNQAYWPLARPGLEASLVVRSSVDLGGQMMEIARGLDPDLVVASTRLTQLLARTLAGTRFLAELLTALAIATILLAALGVYVLLMLVITRRRPELALRTALGAPRRALLLRVGRVVLSPGLVGLVAGFALSYPFVELIASRLFLADPPGSGTRLVAIAGLLVVLVGAAIPPLVSTLRVAPGELLEGQ